MMTGMPVRTHLRITKISELDVKRIVDLIVP